MAHQRSAAQARARPWRHGGLAPALALPSALAALAALAGARGGVQPQAQSAAVAVGRGVERVLAALAGPSAVGDRLLMLAAALVAALVVYSGAVRVYGRSAAALAALLPALAPADAVVLRGASPDAFVLTAAAAAVAAALAGARPGRGRIAWLAAAVALAAIALIPLGPGPSALPTLGASPAGIGGEGAGLAALPLVTGAASALAGVFVLVRRPRRSARRRAAALVLAALVGALALSALGGAGAVPAALFALPAGGVLFGAGATAMARALGRRGWARFALAGWVTLSAGAQFALLGSGMRSPLLPAIALVVAVAASLVLALGRLPLFDAPGRVSAAVPVVLALAALLALPAALTLQSAAPALGLARVHHDRRGPNDRHGGR